MRYKPADSNGRTSVPRKATKNQTTGKGAGTRVLARKPAENTYGGGPGWDKGRSGKNVY